MDGNFLQRLKFVVHMLLPLSGDAVLILLGLITYLATCLLTRHPLTWAWALVPGLCLAVALEIWEIWDYYGRTGLSDLGGAGIVPIAVRHSRDILIMNLAPLAVFVAAHILGRIVRG